MNLQFFLYYALIGIVMYALDALLLKIRKKLMPTSYLLSGLLAGTLFGVLMQSMYHFLPFGWMLPAIISLCGSVLLFLAAQFDLYTKSFFQLLGTMILGLSTGIISWLLISLISTWVLDPLLSFHGLRATLIDLIIFGFLIHFGYATTSRIVRGLSGKKSSL